MSTGAGYGSGYDYGYTDPSGYAGYEYGDPYAGYNAAGAGYTSYGGSTW